MPVTVSITLAVTVPFGIAAATAQKKPTLEETADWAPADDEIAEAEPRRILTRKEENVTTDVNPSRYSIRHARACDIPAIRAMQARSMWTLGAAFYTEAEIANFMNTFGTMDDALVIEGHFFIAEDPGGSILASGAWSRARPGYAAGMPATGPEADIPTVRSVFVDPVIARRGVGSAIMRRVEEDAALDGVRLLGLTATLSGAPLYERLGYQVQEVTQIIFPDKNRFGCVKMTKQLAVRIEAACSLHRHKSGDERFNVARGP